MGKNSPMEYIGRHKDGELVQLRFRDIDTGEEKIVEQLIGETTRGVRRYSNKFYNINNVSMQIFDSGS